MAVDTAMVRKMVDRKMLITMVNMINDGNYLQLLDNAQGVVLDSNDVNNDW